MRISNLRRCLRKKKAMRTNQPIFSPRKISFHWLIFRVNYSQHIFYCFARENIVRRPWLRMSILNRLLLINQQNLFINNRTFIFVSKCLFNGFIIASFCTIDLFSSLGLIVVVVVVCTLYVYLSLFVLLIDSIQYDRYRRRNFSLFDHSKSCQLYQKINHSNEFKQHHQIGIEKKISLKMKSFCV